MPPTAVDVPLPDEVVLPRIQHEPTARAIISELSRKADSTSADGAMSTPTGQFTYRATRRPT